MIPSPRDNDPVPETHDYLLFHRMRWAAAALRETDRQIKEIAYDAGYPDPARFTRMFRRQIGVSPMRYRESLPPISR